VLNKLRSKRKPEIKQIIEAVDTHNMTESFYNKQMAELLKLAHSGKISLEELRDKGFEIIDDVIKHDSKGYEGDQKYLALKIVARQLDNLHDDFTREYFEKNKEALLKLVELLAVK
jgi:hypothetical protein